MALKGVWEDKVNGKDRVKAEDINAVAKAVIELEKTRIPVSDVEPSGSNVWISPNEDAPSGDTLIDVVASVGQTIVVKEVDENGKPTKWKAVDFPEAETITLDEIDIICSASSGMLEAGLYNVYNSEWIYSWYELFRNNILNTDIFIQTSRLTAVFANKALIAGDLIIPDIEQGFEIDSDAFSGCTALRGITIPATVTSIGADSFANCTSLESVIFKGTTAQWNTIVDPRLGKDYWAANTPLTTVYCSNGTVVL